MHDVHPNELARLVNTVESLVKRVKELEKGFESPRPAQEVPQRPAETNLGELWETVQNHSREISTLKMKVGEVSHRASKLNEKTNTIKTDVDKIRKSVDSPISS